MDPIPHTAAKPPEGPLPPPSLGGLGSGGPCPRPSIPGDQLRPRSPAPTAPRATARLDAARRARPRHRPPPPRCRRWRRTRGRSRSPLGVGYAPPPAAAPQANTQHINFLRFDLQYQLESGPSGVSRIDLYVTRDEGRTWTRWSQHDGRETPLRVQLDTRFNQQPEGDYGFRLVPVSGAGLTDGAPTAGTAPEMRVHVDVTPPMIKVFAPTADPNQRNTLVLHWEATDRTFGRDPIAIEWSEQPTGPWKPVASDGVVIDRRPADRRRPTGCRTPGRTRGRCRRP